MIPKPSSLGLVDDARLLSSRSYKFGCAEATFKVLVFCTGGAKPTYFAALDVFKLQRLPCRCVTFDILRVPSDSLML